MKTEGKKTTKKEDKVIQFPKEKEGRKRNLNQISEKSRCTIKSSLGVRRVFLQKFAKYIASIERKTDIINISIEAVQWVQCEVGHVGSNAKALFR